MALIKCPECKKKISDQCGKCPNCGYPIEIAETPVEILDNEVIENEPIIEEKTDVSKKERKPINKKLLIGIISVTVTLILIVAFTLLGLTLFNENWKDATHNFTIVSNKLERMNDELDSLIQKSENLVENKDKALNEEKRAVLKGTISDAKKARKEVSKKPLLAKDIEIVTNIMEGIDYTEIVKSLEEKYNDFEKSIKQYKLVDNPTEEYLLSRLKTVKGIFNITAYTEETDTDKHLNKAKWYYSKIAFQHEDIKDSAIEYGYSIEEVGNPAGGCVEAFKTVEDAERRNQEMQSYEGTVRSPGTHRVIGTVLVRTSEDLTTAKQKELEQAIIDALTYIEEDESKKKPVVEDKPAEITPTTTAPTTQQNNQQTSSKPKQEPTKSQKELAIEAAYKYRDDNKDTILSVYELYEHLNSLGYSDAICEEVCFTEKIVGFYDGSAVYDYEKIIMFHSLGYSRQAIINFYDGFASDAEIEYLVDECLAGRKLTYEYIDDELQLVEHD